MKRGDPDPTASTPVEELVTRALEVLENEGPAGLEALLTAHAEHAPAVRRRLSWLVDSGLASTGLQASAPRRMGDFELLEPLGQGGMGIVYRARQVSLGREVALKVVRHEQLYFPGQRERFRREVDVVAGLAHPGIVPIYSVGEHEGTPYFAMERVRGVTLSQLQSELEGVPIGEREGRHALDALARTGADPNEPASALFDGDWPCICLRIVREAAEALEHAHRRGVVHRDVKPSNLMVTRGGRVLVLDFGLAADADSQVAAPTERLTRTGLQLGTLAYMSPEQLRAERRLDARSDVFSLGVTLYELLTGRLPLDPGTQARTGDGSGHGVPGDLRRIDPRISRELEIVVQTATALAPEERYSNAAALARDLGNVLEGRPIEARAAHPLRVALLWVRRHPALALAATLAVATPLALAWRESKARAEIAVRNARIEKSARELEQALEQATEQRDLARQERARAERALARAHDSVELMLSRVGGEMLLDTPQSELVRRQLLTDALELQAALLAEPAVTREQLSQHARTLQRATGIHAELGQYEKALDFNARQVELLAGLLAQAPSDQVSFDLASAKARRGELERLSGRLDAARLALLDALAGFDELSHPTEASRRAGARARIELAHVLGLRRESAARAELLQAAAEALEPLALDPKAPWEARLDLAKAYAELGSTPHELVGDTSAVRDPAEDSRWLQRALDVLAPLSIERPDQPRVMQREGEVRVDLALRRMQMRDLPGAAREYDLAIERFERLLREFPARPVHAEALASACYNRSLIAAMQEEATPRVQMLVRAVELYERLVANSGNPACTRGLMLALAHRGDAFGSGTDARRCFERALELGTALLPSDGDGSMRRAVAWAASRLAGVTLELGDARACAEAAERLAGCSPRAVDDVWAAAWLVQAAGLSTTEAGTWTERALQLLERAAERDAKDVLVRRELRDPAFHALEGTPRFEAVLARCPLE